MQAYLAPREIFFLLSAHRFFIISEIRFLPSAVRRRRFLAGGAGTLATGDAFRGVRGNSGPSKATIAVFSRSRSRFNSFTIAWISKDSSVVSSFHAETAGQSSMITDDCRGRRVSMAACLNFHFTFLISDEPSLTASIEIDPPSMPSIGNVMTSPCCRVAST